MSTTGTCITLLEDTPPAEVLSLNTSYPPESCRLSNVDHSFTSYARFTIGLWVGGAQRLLTMLVEHLANMGTAETRYSFTSSIPSGPSSGGATYSGYASEWHFRFDEPNQLIAVFDGTDKATHTFTGVSSWATSAIWLHAEGRGLVNATGLSLFTYLPGVGAYKTFTGSVVCSDGEVSIDWLGSTYCNFTGNAGGMTLNHDASHDYGDAADHLAVGSPSTSGALESGKPQIEYLPLFEGTPGSTIPPAAETTCSRWGASSFDWGEGLSASSDVNGLVVGVFQDWRIAPSGVPGGYLPVASAPVTKGAGNLFRLPCGYSQVPRGGKVYRRAQPTDAWVSGGTYTTSRALLVGAQGVHQVTLTDSTTKLSVDHGATLSSGLAARLPAAVTYWRNATNGLTDGRYDDSDGQALGVGTKASGSDTLVFAVGKGYSGSAPTETTVGTLTSAEVNSKPVWPICWRAADGQWWAGAFVNGKWYDWDSTATDGTAWGSRASQTLAATCNLTGVAHVECRSGRQLAAGYHPTDGKVYVWTRINDEATWAGPYLSVAVASAVVPYVTELDDGRLEVGWLIGTTWTRYRAGAPGSTWSVVT